MEEKKKPLAQLETDPKGFMERMQSDPIWTNRVKKEAELRLKMGWPPRPHPKDYPDKKSWEKALISDDNAFLDASGIDERGRAVTALFWSGKFDQVKPGDPNTILDVSTQMNYIFGECTLEDVVAEYHRRLQIH